ncbi:hypothetical protein TNCV_2789261 [Trichonephila clavipes]|uniref:Uncharacterized protein n=1 Tax=Trichonephila clavipes TaxID=2585209 RepID=A0A8X6VW77_TRICX|nr:hypothetical protein TNCV_2789261 [Trichonephila clavipes]
MPTETRVGLDSTSNYCPPSDTKAYQLLHCSINRQAANRVAKNDANLALSPTFRYVSNSITFLMSVIAAVTVTEKLPENDEDVNVEDLKKLLKYHILFKCNVDLETTMEKNPHPTKAFCDGSIHLRKQIACDQPSVLEQAVKRVRQGFVRSPRKSTRVAACEFGMPQKRHGIFNKKIKFQAVSFAIDTSFVQQYQPLIE